jgi:nitrilase
MDRNQNLSDAERLISDAASSGASLVVLPEVFDCYPDTENKVKLSTAEAQIRVQKFLSEMALRHKITLVGGTSLVPAEPGRVHNRCNVISPEGKLLAHYDKIHLFDVNVGAETHRESALTKPGSSPVTVETPCGKLGLSICYDLRFPELFTALALDGAQIIIMSAAFTSSTGPAHWELLLRARAVETQCFILASNQWGKHQNGYKTWGHSMIVDPWGEVLCQKPEGTGIVTAELDFERMKKIRTRMPCAEHHTLFPQ